MNLFLRLIVFVMMVISPLSGIVKITPKVTSRCRQHSMVSGFVYTSPRLLTQWTTLSII